MKPRPLSEHAVEELRQIALDPVPCCTVNPGVIGKLTSEGYVTTTWLPSIFKTHKGRKIPFLIITQAGREALHK